MNITIDPVRMTEVPFCEADGCFNNPEWAVTIRDRQTGTETVAVSCHEHVKDMLPVFEGAA